MNLQHIIYILLICTLSGSNLFCQSMQKITKFTQYEEDSSKVELIATIQGGRDVLKNELFLTRDDGRQELVWMVEKGSADNEYANISKLKRTEGSLAFLLSNTLGVKYILLERQKDGTWLKIVDDYVVMGQGKGMDLVKLELKDMTTVSCEYKKAPNEIFKVSNNKKLEKIE